MISGDKILNQLTSERIILVKRFDCNEIDEQTYKDETGKIEAKIVERREILIQQDMVAEEDRTKKLKEAKSKMVEKVEKPKAIGRKPQKESYASYIVEALQMKSVKNFDDLTAKVLEKKPGRDAKRLKAQVKIMLKEIKAQDKDRWKQYTWDEDAFLLTKKE